MLQLALARFDVARGIGQHDVGRDALALGGDAVDPGEVDIRYEQYPHAALQQGGAGRTRHGAQQRAHQYVGGIVQPEHHS